MKQLIALIIMAAILFAKPSVIYSQDTTCIPNSELKKALQLIEQGKVDKAEKEQLENQKLQLQGIILSKENQIQNQAAQIRNFSALSSNYQGQIILKDETINSLNKALKNQKHKTFWTGAAGIVIAGTLIFLLK